MTVLLQMDFPSQGPWGEEMSTAFEDLAHSIAQEPGLLWKIWTERREEGIAGGVYLFASECCARRYLDMHSQRLAEFGIDDIRARMFEVNEPLTHVTRGPHG